MFPKKYITDIFLLALIAISFALYRHSHAQLQQAKAENTKLALELRQSQQQIGRFYQQLNQYQQELSQLASHAEQREDEIQQTLQQHQNWADQPLPDDIKRLFQ